MSYVNWCCFKKENELVVDILDLSNVCYLYFCRLRSFNNFLLVLVDMMLFNLLLLLKFLLSVGGLDIFIL